MTTFLTNVVRRVRLHRKSRSLDRNHYYYSSSNHVKLRCYHYIDIFLYNHCSYRFLVWMLNAGYNFDAYVRQTHKIDENLMSAEWFMFNRNTTNPVWFPTSLFILTPTKKESTSSKSFPMTLRPHIESIERRPDQNA